MAKRKAYPKPKMVKDGWRSGSGMEDSIMVKCPKCLHIKVVQLDEKV